MKIDKIIEGIRALGSPHPCLPDILNAFCINLMWNYEKDLGVKNSI